MCHVIEVSSQHIWLWFPKENEKASLGQGASVVDTDYAMAARLTGPANLHRPGLSF